MSRQSILEEIELERIRQDKKWGEQNHIDGTGPDEMMTELPAYQNVMRVDHFAHWAKLDCQRRGGEVPDTWSAILLEEVTEAMEQRDPAKLRAELVQVAAVAAQWIEAIDRRPGSADSSDAERQRVYESMCRVDDELERQDPHADEQSDCGGWEDH